MSPNDDQLRWMEQFGELAHSGTPLPDGLRSAADECESRNVARQFRKLASALEAGASWETILAGKHHGLPPHLAALVRAGIETGHLGEALDGLVEHHRCRRNVWRQLVWALAYPGIILGMSLILLLFALVYFVPAMAEVFVDFGTELPAFTMFWIKLAQIFPPLCTCIVVGLTALLLLVRMFGGAVGWCRFVASVPIFGPMFHWASVAELIRVLQICTIQDIRLPESLRLAAATIGNANVSRVSHWLANGTEQGVPLATMLDATPRIPNFIVPVIQWGEQQNALDDAFTNVHDLLIGRIRMRCSLLSGTLAPLVFIFVAVNVGGLVVGMLMPLVSLIQNLT